MKRLITPQLYVVFLLLSVFFYSFSSITAQTIIRPENISHYTGYLRKTVTTGIIDWYEGAIKCGRYYGIPGKKYRGMAIFSLYDFPQNAIIDDITLHTYTNTAGGSGHSIIIYDVEDPWELNIVTLWNDLGGGNDYASFYTAMRTTGYHSVLLNQDAEDDLQNELGGSNQWAVGFYEYSENDDYGIFDGYNCVGQPEPYCNVNWHLPPPTTVSASYGYYTTHIPISWNSVNNATH